jgi:peptidoglycan/xylan/chitin deacetylase (PgdA/CDA1 family)
MTARGAATPQVSVVIPAHDAAATLAATLDSLIGQAEIAWEAIVVNDGSNDDTWALARSYAQGDGRIQAVRCPHAGVSAARNAGLAQARAPWVMFLDADDALDPDHLQLLLEGREQHPDAEVIHGGWQVAFPDRLGPVTPPLDLANAFDVAARRAPFAIHAAMTRRDRLDACGGFDEALRCAEDWDLWQRLARSGAVFRPSRAVARYTIRRGSLSNNLGSLLRDGLAVIARGHAADPRVAQPVAAHAQGAPPARLASAKAAFALWVAGVAVGRGQGEVLRAAAEACRGGVLDPYDVAWALLEGLERATAAEQESWAPALRSAGPALRAFLDAVEAVQLAPRLASRTLRQMERLVCARLRPDVRGVFGALQILDCEHPPRADITPEPGVERLRLVVHGGGRRLGQVDLLAPRRLDRQRLAALLADEFGPPPPTTAEPPAPTQLPDSPAPAPALAHPAPAARVDLPGLVALTYHRVAEDGPQDLRDYRAAPARFAAQMQWLADHGYAAISLPQLEAHVWSGEELPPRAVLISFDDGYLDVLTHAAPVMARHGFVGAMFLVSDRIGQAAIWDDAFGPPARLLDGGQLKALRRRGWSFGAHGARHAPLTGLSPDELRKELSGCRKSLARRLGACTTLAYPYGDVDEAIAREAYALGFRLAFTCEPATWRRGRPVMTFPRLTVQGDWAADQLGAAIRALP